MEVILLEDVDKLGKKGERVQVRDGYARNYLIPKRIALPATPGGIRRFEEEQKHRAIRELKMQREAEEVAKALKKVSCTAEVLVGEDDKVFGAVTAADIAELLAAQGFEIDRRKILLDEPLRALGVYTIPIYLYKDVEAKIKVWVVKKAASGK
ncbi:MAG: 50S ribosomal protein L9 [bacterium]